MGSKQLPVARGVTCKRGHDAWRQKTRQWRCAVCEQETIRQWRRDNAERLEPIKRDIDYRRRYGITLVEYDVMLAGQDGNCALCGEPPKKIRLSVDHDHDTGAIRQLLCTRCNVALAHLENPVWFANATDYLKRHHPERHLD